MQDPKQDPDPKPTEKYDLDMDPDPKKIIPDPQHCRIITLLFQLGSKYVAMELKHQQ